MRNFGLRGFFTHPKNFIHEARSFFSQKEKFGLRGFFTSPIFSSMRGKGGRKKGGELDAAVVIKYNPVMLSVFLDTISIDFFMT
jgi:hypothetical protein